MITIILLIKLFLFKNPLNLLILYLSLENIEKSFIFIEKFNILYLLDKEDLTKIYKIMNWSKN